MIRILSFALALALLGGTAAYAAPTPAPSPAPTSTADAAAAVQAAAWVRAIQAGTIDRASLTPEMDKLLTPALVTATAAQLGPLGAPVAMRQTQLVHKDGNTARVYAVDFAHASLTFVYATDDATGKVSGLRFSNAE
jgi:hypothetical protein